MTEKSLSASRHVAAPPSAVFDLLATPARHPEIDASGTVIRSRTGGRLTGAGDVFVMEMHGRDMGDYLVDNHVVAFTEDRVVEWAPATHGGDRGGQRWAHHLEPEGDGTRVTHVYDWSEVTLERLLPYLPVVDADGLAATLDRLAAAVEG
ncbi:SRPBCC family protein [Pseudonocardia alni subsp. carboxydivorans]|uniref:SRPBCC family protein n=1 Tax=Pseudonocardia alni subsp. carboxydivorans TaxID=415010 RepID=A0ABU9AJU4_PSEA5